MELQNRARRYARVVGLLYSRRDLSGRLVSATRGARHLSLGVRLGDPLKLDAALALAEPLALATNITAVIAQRLPTTPGLVSYQFELPAGYWQSYTRADVTGLGVGLGESRRQIDFGFDPPHAGVFGTTDSGKSETVKSILAGLFTTYTPDELGAVIIDPHRDFEDFQNAAHLVAPVASTIEGIDHALAWAGQELARRLDANERDGKRVVVVIDEAEDALGDDKRLAIAQRIGAEARKYLMNLIVSTQKPTQRNLPDLVDKLNNRWVGLVDNAHTSALLTGQAGLACHKLTGKGDFVHVAGATVERLQVAVATRADFDRLPRAEIEPPEVDEEDTPHILNYPVEKSPGRPPNVPEPKAVAAYAFYGPGKISIQQAQEMLGLSRRAHRLNRDFAKEMLAELKRLMVAVERGIA